MYIDIIRIIKIPDANNNDKYEMIVKLIQDAHIENLGGTFRRLGQGTNRMAVQIDGYAFKIALDSAGCIDNRREMLYTKELQPYVIKVYECTPSGLIAVSEYVDITESEYVFSERRDEVVEILESISENYLIGDCGITGKNYLNWGVRDDGSLCILDFAYIYSVSYKVFVCTGIDCEEHPTLEYEPDFVTLKCPSCGRKYTFGSLRRKITSKEQEEEIGDIRRLSYNIHSAEEMVELIPEFEPQKKEKKKKKKASSNKELPEQQRYKKGKMSIYDIDDYWLEDDENEEMEDKLNE